MNNMDDAKASFYKGVECLEKHDFPNAEMFFSRTLEVAPRSIPSLNNLALAQYQQKKYSDASITAKKAMEIDPTNSEAYLMLASCQKEKKYYDEALSTLEILLKIDSSIADAHVNRGCLLNEFEKYNEAIESFDRALLIQPICTDAFINRGNALRNLKRYDEAFAAYDRALAIKPDLEGAWVGRGNVFYDLKRYDEAFAAYDRALAIKQDLENAWLGRGSIFYDLKRYDEAFAAYDRALAIKPDLEGAWVGRGNIFYDLKRYDEAFAAYDRALAIKQDLENAWLGRGSIFYDLKRYDEAFAAYDRALAIKPDLEGAWVGRGNVFNELKRYAEAFAAYDKALSIKPDLIGVEGARLHAKMHLCDWNNFDAECKHLISSIRSGSVSTPPFAFLAIPSSPEDQLQCAKLWIAEKCPPSQVPISQGERYQHDRIRVAYVSADFRQHPVSFLIAGMLECHDKSRFNVTAISLGPDDNSEMRRRLEASFELFIDANTFSDDQIANLIRSSEVDILVDLMGFTESSRTSVFARRPAPIQVNYLGYLGTTGAEYIDYIIADQIVIPKNRQEFYTEKTVYLPNSFQPTDRKRAISDKKFTRADVGLPREGFIFCCFNTNYKITPDVYDIWMRVLRKAEGSVLWLFAESSTVKRNLRNEATARGVNAERLIFAPHMSLPEHQARLRLADLFLDTLPYNAGTTASDMLWAGLPVLTRVGDAFVGRMAASLLNAIHLPELITTTAEAYEQMAIDLATHPEKVSSIKRKLAENRLTTPLFDTERFAKHIEAAYSIMWERYQRGAPPESFSVDPLEQHLKYQ